MGTQNDSICDWGFGLGKGKKLLGGRERDEVDERCIQLQMSLSMCRFAPLVYPVVV